jgi:hypothetical protein
MHARIPETDRPRWPITAAMLDLWCYPWSARYYRYVQHLILQAGGRIAGSGVFVDVLGLTTEFDYFLSFPS